MVPYRTFLDCFGDKGGYKRAKLEKRPFLGVKMVDHSAHNPRMCLVLVGHSQGDLSAYLRLLVGTMEGLLGSLEVRKWPKMGQNCMFWGKSTL